jgi:hypothetical protein
MPCFVIEFEESSVYSKVIEAEDLGAAMKVAEGMEADFDGDDAGSTNYEVRERTHTVVPLEEREVEGWDL